ncbi:hypothetical protein [Streptomyces sp. NPDC004270]
MPPDGAAESECVLGSQGGRIPPSIHQDLADLCLEGTKWTTATTLYRAERSRRWDSVPADGPWTPVWTVMETPAGVHGEESVRLVAWFDE